MDAESAGTGARGPATEEVLVYQLTVLYNHPDDAAAFDKHYDEVHIPLASKMPGLRRYTVSHPAPGPDGSKPDYHLVAVLEFDDEAAFGAAVTSAEGQAATGDVPNFATGGATMLAGPATQSV
jgi:uncharacterized protein (TIGR02118 family)